MAYAWIHKGYFEVKKQLEKKFNFPTFFLFNHFKQKKNQVLGSKTFFIELIIKGFEFESYYLKLLYPFDDLNELLKIDIMAYEDFNISTKLTCRGVFSLTPIIEISCKYCKFKIKEKSGSRF